jgi:3-deoxy-7-phosphoheptulonate synthase
MNINKDINDINITKYEKLISPNDLLFNIPNDNNTINFIKNARQTITNILKHIDDRIIVIIGPDSIKDLNAAYTYATLLKKISKKYENQLFIIMYIQFENLKSDNEYDINNELYITRQLLLNINDLKLPCGIEFLDTISPQYLSDLISWGIIGSRTTESQIYRELASGLSVPIGFKNGTDGNIKMALDAVEYSSKPHNFLGINNLGQASIIQTKGNKHCHVVLRGSYHRPNYYLDDLAVTNYLSVKRNLIPNIMIDCSHGNSEKNQKSVIKYLSDIIKTNIHTICGLIIESNIFDNKQDYGMNFTDKCINYDELILCLDQIADSVKYKIINKQLAS